MKTPPPKGIALSHYTFVDVEQLGDQARQRVRQYIANVAQSRRQRFVDRMVLTLCVASGMVPSVVTVKVMME